VLIAAPLLLKAIRSLNLTNSLALTQVSEPEAFTLSGNLYALITGLCLVLSVSGDRAILSATVSLLA